MNTYQVRFPVVTVAEDSETDAVRAAYEALGRLLRDGQERAFVNQVIPLEAKQRLDVWDWTTRLAASKPDDPPHVG